MPKLLNFRRKIRFFGVFFVPLHLIRINQEIDPYVAETHMSIMGRELPQKMQEAGFEIRTFMPKWGTINERRGQLHEVIRLSGMNLIIDDTDHPLIIKVASIPTTRQQIYFIDNDDYFTGVLETVKKLRWQPDVIVCQGWVSAVVPFYIKTAYAEEPSFANSKVILSLYTNELKAELGTNFKQCVDYRDAKAELLADYKENFDFTELGKMAIDYSDGVIEGESMANRTLLDYANEKSKPTLAYPGDDFADAYKTFINEVCPDEE